MPDEIPDAIRSAERHVMGGIHATEHAALALVPLFALCDRFDVAGISYVKHPQLGRAAIFLYDGHAGGVGLMASVFEGDEIDEAQIEALKDREHLSDMMTEFARVMPQVKEPLIDERDLYLISSVEGAPGNTVVAAP